MSFGTLLVLLSACGAVLSQRTGSIEEHVDLIELNHFYDAKGRHVYDQVIFYEQSPETARFQVRAWCLVEDREVYHRRPVRNPETQLMSVDWLDNDQKILRKITSKQFRESWSQIDPERANKRMLDERYRTSLIQYPKKPATIIESLPSEKSPPAQLASVAAERPDSVLVSDPNPESRSLAIPASTVSIGEVAIVR